MTRKIGNKNVTFDVYDSVQNFSHRRWLRIVAVVTSGQDWQFKDWKNGSQKRELFARVRGFYLYFNGTKTPATVDSWNVKKLELQRHKRHHDVNIKNTFWADLEEFLKREKF